MEKIREIDMEVNEDYGKFLDLMKKSRGKFYFSPKTKDILDLVVIIFERFVGFIDKEITPVAYKPNGKHVCLFSIKDETNSDSFDSLLKDSDAKIQKSRHGGEEYVIKAEDVLEPNDIEADFDEDEIENMIKCVSFHIKDSDLDEEEQMNEALDLKNLASPNNSDTQALLEAMKNCGIGVEQLTTESYLLKTKQRDEYTLVFDEQHDLLYLFNDRQGMTSYSVKDGDIQDFLTRLVELDFLTEEAAGALLFDAE